MLGEDSKASFNYLGRENLPPFPYWSLMHAYGYFSSMTRRNSKKEILSRGANIRGNGLKITIQLDGIVESIDRDQNAVFLLILCSSVGRERTFSIADIPVIAFGFACHKLFCLFWVISNRASLSSISSKLCMQSRRKGKICRVQVEDNGLDIAKDNEPDPLPSFGVWLTPVPFSLGDYYYDSTRPSLECILDQIGMMCYSAFVHVYKLKVQANAKQGKSPKFQRESRKKEMRVPFLETTISAVGRDRARKWELFWF
eukprot:Gb_35830 [translate_table: standard]